MNSKLGRHIGHSRPSAGIVSEIRRSEVKVTGLWGYLLCYWHGSTVVFHFLAVLDNNSVVHVTNV